MISYLITMEQYKKQQSINFELFNISLSSDLQQPLHVKVIFEINVSNANLSFIFIFLYRLINIYNSSLKHMMCSIF